MQNIAKQNYPGLVAFYDTRPGNEVGLILQHLQAHTGLSNAALHHT